jgi:hypothetical protein
MTRLKIALSALAFTACATSSGSTTADAKPATAKNTEPVKLSITNVIPFDVASCTSRPITLSPLTAEVLTGAMLSMSPATQECFVDPAAREGNFDLKGKITVSDSGVTYEFTGTGASASGKACLEGAYKKLNLVALPAGAKPITAEIPLSAIPQQVKLGDNPANDIAGRLRLSQATFCECYAPVAMKTPPNLKVEVEVAQGGAVKATFPTSDEITTCLTGKVQALKLGENAGKMTWPFLLKNSYATDVDTTAPAALQFQQLDGMRAQRTSDVLIAAGQRVSAALAFDDLAQKYKKKPAKGMLEELKTKCADVVAGDDKQIAAVKALVAVLESSQKLATAEKAKDAQWGQVEEQLGNQLKTSTAEVVRVEEQKKNDQNACPKTKY